MKYQNGLVNGSNEIINESQISDSQKIRKIIVETKEEKYNNLF